MRPSKQRGFGRRADGNKPPSSYQPTTFSRCAVVRLPDAGDVHLSSKRKTHTILVLIVFSRLLADSNSQLGPVDHGLTNNSSSGIGQTGSIMSIPSGPRTQALRASKRMVMASARCGERLHFLHAVPGCQTARSSPIAVANANY